MSETTVEFISYQQSVTEALEGINAKERLVQESAILIKPNLVNATPHPVTTPAACCEAIIQYVRSFSKAEIVIAEGTGDASRQTHEIFDILGYTKLAARHGTSLVDLNEAPLQKLKNLEDYIHADDLTDPLVKMAIIHYQFEAIHPFFDGNGRAGRILLLLYLKLTGLLDLPALFLSRYIIENKGTYYTKLRGVTEKKDWQGWILYMLDMIEQSAKQDRKRILEIEALMLRMGQEIQERLPKVYSKDLLEILFRLPYTKRQFLEEAKLGTLKTVGNYLQELEQAGFLRSEQVGKEKLYLNFRLLKALIG